HGDFAEVTPPRNSEIIRVKFCGGAVYAGCCSVGALGSLDHMHRATLTNVGAPVRPEPGMAHPDFPPHYLPRPRLVTQLDAAVQSPITLVSAAAGWGKTAVLAE